jgi:DNA-binding LytR/AlgR family response regulator
MEDQIKTPLFFRIHRSYIVNINHIESFGFKQLTLKNKLEIPVSDSYKQELLKRLNLI